jgi:hypothetical protein
MFSIFNHKPLTKDEWEKFQKKNAEKIAERNASEQLLTDDSEMSFQQLKALLKNPPDENAGQKNLKN